MPTYGQRPDDVVADSRGNALKGVLLKLYTTEALAKANGTPLGTATTSDDGTWEFTTDELDLYARLPNGKVWQIAQSQEAMVAAAESAAADATAAKNLAQSALNSAQAAATSADSAATSASTTANSKVTKGADVVNVKDYGAKGDGTTDDTDAINAAITANPGRTIVLPKGTYIVDALKNAAVQTPYMAGIRLNQAGTHLRLDPAATIKCKPNNAQRYSIVEMSAPDTAISGGAIVGDLATHLGSTGEWGYCINITPAADRCRIQDMRLSDPWGDCVLIGDSGSFTSGVLVKDVSIINVTMDRARRNNLSVIACKDLRVIGCSFTNAGKLSGTAPMVGVDVEPNPGGLQDVINATFIGCTFADNVVHGFGVHAQGRTATATLIGCISRNNGQHGYALTSTAGVDFYNCLATGNTLSGFTGDSYTGKASSLVNCRAVGNSSLGFSVSTGMQAIGCTAEDNVVGGILAAGTARVTGCTSKGNNPTSGSQYYGNYAVESGTGVVFTGCHSDAGINATKPSYGWRLFAGVTGTVVTGCSSSGTFTASAFQNSATGTIANPVPGKPVGFAGATTTTTAPAAGGAGALPATPLGYYTVNINGTDRTVAYY